MLLAATRVSLWAATDELEDLLRWHFGPLPDAAGRPDLSIIVDHQPLAHPDLPASMQDGPIGRWEGHGCDLVLRHELGSVARLDADTLHVGVTVPREEQWRVLRQLMFSALSWFFERRGLLVLHGAMVARPDGAVLLVGPTGAGKSTASLAALARGWELHSDDLVVVGLGPGGPVCSGVPKRPSVDSALARHLGWRCEDLPSDARGRLMLAADTLSVGDRPLVAVVGLGHDAGTGRLEILGPDERLTALALSCLEVPRDGVLGRRLALFAAMAALPGYRLLHAADPGVRVERAGELLQRVWDEASQERRGCGNDHRRPQ